jgi:hypothetical protein
MKRVVLVPLAALALLAGCTGGSAAASGTSTASGPASRAASSPPPASPSPSAGVARTSDPGDGSLAAEGADTDWASMVTKCPGEGQKTIVQKVVTADVTGDGWRDALVARTCEASTSYWESSVEVFDGRSPATSPHRLGILLADVARTDAPWLEKLSVSGGEVAIRAYGVSTKGTKACDDLDITYRYRYTGGAFHRVSRVSAPVTSCPDVG